jgi:hypothetical protein
MAGAFTHWMVIEEAVDKLTDGDYSTILGEKLNSVRIGAVGPDYPYMSELVGNLFKIHSWADRMHYENTLTFVKNGLSALFAMDRNGETFKICLAWFCGYVSHLVTDAIIHPVVNANVGGTYIFTKNDHRICEMTQDTWIFFKIKGVDLSNAAYLKLLRDCSDSADINRIHPAIRGFWPGILKATHPGGAAYFDKIDPDKWHKAYLSKLGTASAPIPVFRHMGEEEHLVYKKRSEIADSIEEKKYVTDIKLPNRKTTGNFKEHAFDKAVNKVVEVWQELFVDIHESDISHCVNYLGDWNLDTGLDEDVIIFWG